MHRFSLYQSFYKHAPQEPTKNINSQRIPVKHPSISYMVCLPSASATDHAIAISRARQLYKGFCQPKQEQTITSRDEPTLGASQFI